ncbi:MAG: hypothetical protein J7577_23190 [Sphingobacteriaceae bacterium]|nr:hypothetical protein [Sphingobacteriaceae bacterium]
MNKEYETTEQIADTLIQKGYDGFVISDRASTGKVKDVIGEYLKVYSEDKACRSKRLWLSTYIHWNGEDKPKVSCDMLLKMERGQMIMEKMVIEKRDEYGVMIKKSELNSILLKDVPTAKQAIELVDDTRQQKVSLSKNRKLR